MKKLFNVPESDLLVGTPYTWGDGIIWYVRLAAGSIISLNSFEFLNSAVAAVHLKDATSYPGFQYATSMEIL